MRRSFLVQMILGTVASVFAGREVKASNAPRDPSDADGVLGDWHLLRATENEVKIPAHRMDLRFEESAGRLKGAVLSRNDGSEIPLGSSEFDGSTLRFQMAAPAGKKQAEMPTMVMTRSGAKFEGYWTNSTGERVEPRLKLVRAR